MSKSGTENTKAIVIYVDDTPRCLEEYTWLYKTWRLWNLDREFDLVTYCNPKAVQKLPEMCDSLVIREMRPLSEADSGWNAYPFVNSFAMFNDASEIDFIKKRYSHIMRTDCDVFLTKHLEGHAPARLMLGMGGYVSGVNTAAAENTINNLNRLRKKMGLKNSYVTHIGASIFGPVGYVLVASLKHFALTKHILETEWSTSAGDWASGWFAGVSSMYAIDLAINDIFTRQHIIPYILDECCFEGTSITKNTLHIHAWHSTRYFSKHDWFDGKYSKLELDRVPDKTGQYCHWIASNSLEDLRRVVDSENAP